MKKNDVILITATLLYSYLFYLQSAGINFLAFSMALLILLLIRDKLVYKSKTWLGAAAGTLISAVCIALYANSLSVTANVISLLALSAFSFKPKTSIITSLLFSVFSVAASLVFIIIDAVERSSKRALAVYDREQKSGTNWLLYLIPLVLVFLFFFLYKSSNPLFDNFTNKINFDFISARWVFFTIGGVFLLYGFFYHKIIPYISDKDEAMLNHLSPETVSTKQLLGLSTDNERRSGMILLISLNVLLLLVNLLDANFMFIDSTLPAGLTYSAFVHQGTGTLILSIMVAIGIILFYFRGQLNFYRNNKQLKMLAYSWVLQNVFMIFSTAYRNHLYIAEYSLTYKRIGVYVWLLLALIGLVTTFLKIFKVKSNWYLFRSNGWLFYTVLVISCVFNWDVIVADYNMASVAKNNKAIDKFYLLNLSDKVLPQLLTMNDSIKNKREAEDEIRDSWDSREQETPADNEFKYYLDMKLYHFLDEYKNREWKSWNYYDSYVHARVLALNKQGKIKSITLKGARNSYSLAAIKELDQLMKIETPGMAEVDLSDFAAFKSLRELDLSDCNIQSLRALPRMENLRSLDLSDNRIGTFVMLRNVPNLEVLNISGYQNAKEYASLLQLKHLRRLIIGSITKEGLQTLKYTFPDTDIISTNIH